MTNLKEQKTWFFEDIPNGLFDQFYNYEDFLESLYGWMSPVALISLAVEDYNQYVGYSFMDSEGSRTHIRGLNILIDNNIAVESEKDVFIWNVERKKLNFKTLRYKNSERSNEWNGCEMDQEAKFEDLVFRSNELAGETGEVCNAVKKFARFLNEMVGGKDFKESKQHISEELADVIICVDRVAEVFDIDLEEAIIEKFNKTSKQHNFSVRI